MTTSADERRGRVRYGAALGLLLTAYVLDLGDTYFGVSHLSNVVVLAVAIVALIHRLGTMREVTISTVMGAVMTYAFIAFLTASVYRGIDLLTDEPFFAQGEVARSDYAYFSFVSLTALSFGDLTPGTDLAKRLVGLETFTGQVFLVVAVAQLVSMWVPRRRRPAGTTRSTLGSRADCEALSAASKRYGLERPLPVPGPDHPRRSAYPARTSRVWHDSRSHQAEAGQRSFGGFCCDHPRCRPRHTHHHSDAPAGPEAQVQAHLPARRAAAEETTDDRGWHEESGLIPRLRAS